MIVDVEAVLVAWLESAITGVHASTRTPADLDDHLPWIHVSRIGGPFDGFRRDQPLVDIATFHRTGPQAAQLALDVQRRLHRELHGAVTGGAVFAEVETRVGPHWVPYDNPALVRYEATNAFVIHPA